jgi:hypothetical protein
VEGDDANQESATSCFWAPDALILGHIETNDLNTSIAENVELEEEGMLEPENPPDEHPAHMDKCTSAWWTAIWTNVIRCMQIGQLLDENFNTQPFYIFRILPIIPYPIQQDAKRARQLLQHLAKKKQHTSPATTQIETKWRITEASWTSRNPIAAPPIFQAKTTLCRQMSVEA